MEAEDQKLLILAKATRGRVGVPTAAAIRDLDGRTYAAAPVDLPALQLSALGGAIAMAVSSGAKGLEVAIVLSGEDLTENDLDVVRDFAGTGVPLRRVAIDGSVLEQLVS